MANGLPVIFRPAKESDVEGLVEMYETFGSEDRTMGLPPRDPPAIEDWIEDLIFNGWNLVAETENIIIGHLGVSPVESNAPAIVIFVHPTHQASGIGTELLKQMLAYSGERPHEALKLDVQKENRNAISIYEEIGFNKVGESSRSMQMEVELQCRLIELAQLPPAADNRI